MEAISSFLLQVKNPLINLFALITYLGGTSWLQTTANSANWYAIASDSSGQKLAAAQQGTGGSTAGPGNIFLSTSGGNSWFQASGTPAAMWHAITSDSTGMFYH